MATLAENAAAVKAAQVAIDAAIVAKGGTTEGGLSNAAAAIAALPSGGGGESYAPNDVNFYMPDGTIAKSYSAAEFAELTALPDQPALDGLVAQGWNWTLDKAKAYVGSYGKLNVGGMYITDNGETRLYLTIAEPYRLEQPLRFGRSGGTGIAVDWGDGSAPVTYTHTAQTIVKHAYAGSGHYVIRLSSVGGAKLLIEGSSTYNIFGIISPSANNPSRVYASRLRKIEIGSSVESIGGSNVFTDCYSLSSITIPSSVTSIGASAFSACTALSSITIPSSVTSIGISICNGCRSMSSATIPSSVTSIADSMFYNCTSLSSITIPSSVTSIGSNAFRNCYKISSMTIPSSVTSIGASAFNTCNALSSITISSSATSIGTSAFSTCNSLSSVIIPPSVSSIENSAFNGCQGIVKYDFTEHTNVPNLVNANVFTSIAADCKIVVPDALFDEWRAATNWSSSTIRSHIYKASEYTGA